MDTKKVKALLTALDKGSLTAAAEEMGYTQSGLTHMMNSLEDELGIRILVRSKGGVRLSPAGRELLPQMNALVRCADELEQGVEKLVRRSYTVLRLGAYSSVSRQWLSSCREFSSGGLVNSSRSGSIIANGMQMLNSPVSAPISTWNGVVTTMSFGEVVMLVNFTCISARTYSTSIL